MSSLSLVESTTWRDVYDKCQSYHELLNHSSLPIVDRLTNAIRNWKRRHAVATHDEAFEQHRQHILHPRPSAPLIKRVRRGHTQKSVDLTAAAQAAVTCPLPPPPDLQSSSASGHELLVQLQATTHRLDQLAKDVLTLRAQLQQQNTPSPLVFRPIPARFKKLLKVLSIVGDGRCLLYSLLQSSCSLLPSPQEADQLRSQLKQHLLSSYSASEWEERVPPQLSEGCTPQAFADRFLTGATTHLPPDAICLWQDVLAPSTDVYLLQRSSFEIERKEKVEKIPCQGGAQHAVVLMFTWEGVGHYELVTFNDVTTLPHSHAFVQHLNQLHQQYISGFSKDVRREGRKRKGERHDKDGDEVVE